MLQIRRKMMKRTNFIRLLALVMTVIMVLPFASCTKKEEQAVKTKPTHVYKETDFVSLPDNLETYNILIENNKIVVNGHIISDDYMYQSAVYIMDIDGTNGRFLTIPEEETENGMKYSVNVNANSIAFGKDGNLYCYCNGGYYDEVTGSYSEITELRKYDLSGNLLAKKSAKEFSEQEYVYINKIRINDNGNIFITDEYSIIELDDELNVVNKIELDFQNISNFFIKEGYLIVIGNSEPDWTTKAKKVNMNGSNAVDIEVDSAVLEYSYSSIHGSGYDFYYSDGLSVYGYDFESNASTELLNYINSDINSDYGSNIVFINPDEALFLYNRYNGDNLDSSIKKLTRVPDDQLVEKYEISLGCIYIDYRVKEKVLEFNKASDEYRITIKNYGTGSYYFDTGKTGGEDDYTDPYQLLNNDITAGKVPDILFIDQGCPYDSYVSKGLFIDLYSLMDADENFNREDYLTSVFKACEVNGKLYSLPFSFSLSTLIGKKSLVGEDSGWNMDEFLAAVKKLPEGSRPFRDITRDIFMRNILSVTLNQFVDKNTGKCSFNSSDFIKILEFSKTLSETSIWDSIDWETDDAQDFYKKYDFAFRTEEALLEVANLYDFGSFWQYEKGLFDADVNLIGYPNENKNGNAFMINNEFGITYSCKNKDAAWDFLKVFLSDEFAEAGIYDFPVKISALEKRAATVMDPQNYIYDYPIYREYAEIDEIVEVESGIAIGEETSGEVIDIPIDEPIYSDDESDGEPHNYYYLGDQSFDIGIMTQEAVDELMEIINNTTQICRYNKKIVDIVLEEANVFYAGQNSAQRAAEIIQNKVQNLVSESQ